MSAHRPGSGPEAEPDRDVEAGIAVLKQGLRARMRALPPLDTAARRAAGEAVAARVSDWLRRMNGQRVALFCGAPDEIDTRPLYDRLRAEGRTVLFPRCVEGRRLAFAAAPWEELRPGRYGVREPSAALVAARLSAGDLVCVPGLAFDRFGGRLGRGGGYYDRSLPDGDALQGPWIAGLCLERQRVPRVPLARHDRRMDHVFSERGSYPASPLTTAERSESSRESIPDRDSEEE